MNRPALFLDRDGVINVDYGYVHTRQNFHFIQGIFELVSTASRAGYLVVVVTNQAGIGRGYYNEAQFQDLSDWMRNEFNQREGKIDGVYFCPHHPKHGIGKYQKESEFRKPAPGMLLQAKIDLDIDLKKSILIGDSLSDITAGRLAGVGTLLHLRGEPTGDGRIVIRQLSEALRYL